MIDCTKYNLTDGNGFYRFVEWTDSGCALIESSSGARSIHSSAHFSSVLKFVKESRFQRWKIIVFHEDGDYTAEIDLDMEEKISYQVFHEHGHAHNYELIKKIRDLDEN